MLEKLLRMCGIVKEFSGVEILHSVDFDIDHGEVHALIGENGAGKSTLIKILAGVHPASLGEVYLEGEKKIFKNPKEAQISGISTIHQEFNLVPYLDVASNIFLGREKMNRLGIIDKETIYQEAQVLLDKTGASISPRDLVKDLGVAEKQMVEICKALSTQAKIVIMDEPTAVLSDKEIDKLFEVIRTIKKEGISVIYISHRLEELPVIADRVSVLRDGSMVGELSKEELSKERITKMMIGRDLSEQFPPADKEIGEVILSARHVTREQVLKDVSFELHAGEILGFAGLVGAGRTELMRAVLGVDKMDTGEIFLEGKKVHPKSALEAKKLGMVLIPEERKTQGLVLTRSIEENISLTYLKDLSRFLVVSKSKAEENTKKIIEKLHIKPDNKDILTQKMSGGNQQKVVIGKWIYEDHKVMIFDEPTRGVDVGAKTEIYKIMMNIAKQGVGIIMVSSDLPEVIGMSDRVLVMKEGRISGELAKENLEEHSILQYAF
ncbi:MAG: sugar ABC transporter ATP-binding protein [Blautia sp.]|jgi:ribose transport system ATP-binding protein